MMLRPINEYEGKRLQLQCATCHRMHDLNQTAADLQGTSFVAYYGAACLRELLERRAQENTGRKATLPNGDVEYYVDGVRWTWRKEERGWYPPYRNEGGWLLLSASAFR